MLGHPEVFDIETWACGLAKQGLHDPWNQRCALEKVGRWALVPQTVVAFIVLIVGTAGILAARKDMDHWSEEREKMLRGRRREV